MISVEDLLVKEFPPQPFLIAEGILNYGSIMVIGGAPKSYKSFLSTAVVLHLAVNTPIFGAHRKSHGREQPAFTVSKPCKVLILEQEIGEYDLKERLKMMVAGLLPGEREKFIKNVFVHSCDHTLQFDKQEGMLRIEELVGDLKPDVVVFDPIIEFHTSDENSTHAMAGVLRNLDLLRERHKFATILTHHTGHNQRSGPEALRGNSILFGKGDTFLMLDVLNRNAGLIKITPTIRRGKPITPFHIMLDWSDLRAKFHSWATGKNTKEFTNLVMAAGAETEQ